MLHPDSVRCCLDGRCNANADDLLVKILTLRTIFSVHRITKRIRMISKVWLGDHFAIEYCRDFLTTMNLVNYSGRLMQSGLMILLQVRASFARISDLTGRRCWPVMTVHAPLMDRVQSWTLLTMAWPRHKWPWARRRT